MTFYTHLLVYISFSTLVFNTYGMKKIKQYEKPIKNFGNKFIFQKSGMQNFLTPKTHQIFNINKTDTPFKGRPMSTIKEPAATPSKSWLIKNWEWLKSKFITSPQGKTRSSFADLFLKNEENKSNQKESATGSTIVAQKRKEVEQKFLPVIESLSKANTKFESSHIKFKANYFTHKFRISYYVDNKEIGYIEYILRSDYAYLADVYVDEEYRNYGIGKFLIKAALSHLKSRETNKVSLIRGSSVWPIYSSSQKLHNLYTSLGFKQDKSHPDKYSLDMSVNNKDEE